MKKISKELIKNSPCWMPSLHEGNLIVSNSWFSIRKKQAFNQKNNIQTIKSKNIRCETIYLKPTLKQRNILLDWFELSRLAYNKTIQYLKKDNTIKDRKMRDIIKQDMRNNLYINSLIKNSGVYQQTLDNSVKDVYKARKTAFSNLKLNNIKFFRLRYKKKNYHIKNLVLETDALNKNGLGLKKKDWRIFHQIKKLKQVRRFV